MQCDALIKLQVFVNRTSIGMCKICFKPSMSKLRLEDWISLKSDFFLELEGLDEADTFCYLNRAAYRLVFICWVKYLRIQKARLVLTYFCHLRRERDIRFSVRGRVSPGAV